MWCVARGALAAVLIGLILVGWPGTQAQASAPVGPAAAGSREETQTLTWAPPPCGDATHRCVDLHLSNTGANQTPALSASNDYRIHLPKVPLEGGLQIRGGHNVIIRGGRIDLTVPCSDASSACHAINIAKPTGGEVFVEGVWIHDPQSPIEQSTGDGIDVDDPASDPSDVVLENVRIDGISGCSGGADHADVFQPYSVPGARVYIDHLTGETNCQGATLDPDLAWSEFGEFAAEYVIRNANIDVLRNPNRGFGNRYVWWLTGGAGDGCASGPISLRNVYAQEPRGTLRLDSVWPDSNQPAACPSVWAAPRLSFPRSPQIRGAVTAGRPPCGDYVPEGAAGIAYVSPGYDATAALAGGGGPAYAQALRPTRPPAGTRAPGAVQAVVPSRIVSVAVSVACSRSWARVTVRLSVTRRATVTVERRIRRHHHRVWERVVRRAVTFTAAGRSIIVRTRAHGRYRVTVRVTGARTVRRNFRL